MRLYISNCFQNACINVQIRRCSRLELLVHEIIRSKESKKSVYKKRGDR